jgi:light-regulated signal transduction histidine kinase (bacteriophytochrome)
MHEPIHLSGGIQPHGYLVSCTAADWIVRHVSANCEALFGVAPEALLGQPLREFVEDDVLQAIGETMAFAEPGGPAERAGTANIGHQLNVCDLSVHVAGGLVHVEFEPQPYRTPERTPTGVAQTMIARVVATDDPADFHQRTAEQVRLLTGFDRVMVYRFRHDDSGEVIAESCSADLEPYLGLRYPATDIPPQARALYLRNRVRVIPDAGYAPVPILPQGDAHGAPLDLSQHVLRSVSPVHLEYLRNMGVAASMSISIISGGRLWGLIACHNAVPKPVSPAVRTAADLFGMFVSMRVAAREQEETMSRYERAQHVRDALALRLSEARDYDAALVEELETLGPTFGSDGAALWLRGRWHARGRTPAASDPTPLLQWLEDAGRPPVAFTDRAEDWNTPALLADGLAGVLAINLGAGNDWLFLFRAEEIEHVRWAGEPHKALVVTDDGQRIAPRKSFAVWRETVRDRSVAWSDSDQLGAERLHRILREQRRRAQTHARDLQDLDSLHQRRALKDHKRRLDHIATLLDGLVHLDSAETRRIGARIARLESDLRRLMRHSADDAAALATPIDG